MGMSCGRDLKQLKLFRRREPPPPSPARRRPRGAWPLSLTWRGVRRAPGQCRRLIWTLGKWIHRVGSLRQEFGTKREWLLYCTLLQL